MDRATDDAGKSRTAVTTIHVATPGWIGRPRSALDPGAASTPRLASDEGRHGEVWRASRGAMSATRPFSAIERRAVDVGRVVTSVRPGVHLPLGPSTENGLPRRFACSTRSVALLGERPGNGSESLLPAALRKAQNEAGTPLQRKAHLGG